MTAISKLFGASAAAAVLLLGMAVHAHTTEPAKKKAAAKPASVCKGLDEAACKAKSGKQKPYCRTKAAPKKPAPAKDAAPKK